MRLQSLGICCSFMLIVLSSPGFCQSPVASAAVSDGLPSAHTVSYHDGSIRDIDAIGLRNVGCRRGIGNWYSLEHQIAMGKEYASRIDTTAKMVTDPEVVDYINRLGQQLVRNSDAQVSFTIKVIDSDQVNAVALPGGFFYIDSGLITAADNEAELAGVMSHEIAHVAACHAARERTRGQWLGMASVSLTFVGGPIAYAAYESMSVARPLTLLRFSRKFESQADFMGAQYMYRAGYDPQALPTFFERIRAMEKGKSGAVARAFSTHPQTADRIARTQEEINDLLPAQAEYKVDSSDFEDVKARIYQLTGRIQSQPGGRAVLHRSPSSSDQ